MLHTHGLPLLQLSEGLAPFKDRGNKMIVQGKSGSWGIGLDNSLYRKEATPLSISIRGVFDLGSLVEGRVLSDRFSKLVQSKYGGFDCL